VSIDARRLQPLFLQGAAGSLHATLFASNATRASRNALLVLPPFAEEMNKCRPMMAAVGRRMAEAGCDTLLFDLFGTGDSAGEFSEASWEDWMADVRCARTFLLERGAVRISVLAVRSGALLIAALANESTRTARLALWQPVTRGIDCWRQFLRLRVAAEVFRETTSGAQAETPDAILRRDGAIEIAGYTVAAGLVQGLSDSRFDERVAADFAEVLWAEVSLASPPSLSPAAQKNIDALRATNVIIEGLAVTGEQFWSTPEIGRAPELCDATCRYFLQS
jgi:exosortase A-associated hydrolase 2